MNQAWRNEHTFSKRGVNVSGGEDVGNVIAFGGRSRVFEVSFPKFWNCSN